jgi:hypothetical protein
MIEAVWRAQVCNITLLKRPICQVIGSCRVPKHVLDAEVRKILTSCGVLVLLLPPWLDCNRHQVGKRSAWCDEHSKRERGQIWNENN